MYVSFFGQASDGIRVGQWDLSIQRMKEIPFYLPPRSEQDQMLYNYALIKFHLTSVRQRRDYDVNAALQFADLLSNSTHTSKADDHKMWAQEIISLLLELEPENEQVKYYAGSVLTNVGNFRGRELVKSSYTERTLQEKAFATFCKQYLTIPADKSKTFFLQQKNIYDRLSSNFLSYSAPTSMGKSFIMHMFIKEQIMNGVKMNFARIVPTKALINEMRNDTINVMKRESIILYCTRNGINSIGVRTSDGFVVKKGSIISQKITKSCPDYVLKKRTQHKNIIDANNMLTEDILFNTPSGASSFACGASTNGNIEWKTSEGITLKSLNEQGK